MLQPKKIRWRKHHKELQRLRGITPRGASLNFGTYGLKAMEPGRITARQIESGPHLDPYFPGSSGVLQACRSAYGLG